MDLLALSDQAHRALTVLAALGAAAVLAVALSGVVVSRSGHPPPTALRAVADLLVLTVPFLVAASAAFGLVLFAAAGGPRDGLHAIYGAVALVALPLARVLGAGPPIDPEIDPGDLPGPEPLELTGRLGIWLAVGAVFTLGALVRLAGTG